MAETTQRPDVADVLQRIAAAGTNPKLSGPFMGRFGEWPRWAFATDGRGALFVSETNGMDFPEPDTETLVKHAGIFYMAPAPCWEGWFRDLKTWCGDAEWRQPCPACNGTSEHSEYVVCSFCECNGFMVPDRRCGVLCGLKIDRNRLAQLLSPFDSVSAAVSSGVSPHQQRVECVVVNGLGFRAVLISAVAKNAILDSEEAEPWEAAPVFPEP